MGEKERGVRLSSAYNRSPGLLSSFSPEGHISFLDGKHDLMQCKISKPFTRRFLVSLRYNSVKLRDLNWSPLGNNFQFNSRLGHWSWILLAEGRVWGCEAWRVGWRDTEEARSGDLCGSLTGLKGRFGKRYDASFPVNSFRRFGCCGVGAVVVWGLLGCGGCWGVGVVVCSGLTCGRRLSRPALVSPPLPACPLSRVSAKKWLSLPCSTHRQEEAHVS